MQIPLLLARVAATTVVGAGLTLGAAVPAFADPGIALDHSTGLTDGQTVTVSGTGFTAGTTMYVVECDLVRLACNTAEIPMGTVAPDGTLSVQVVARKTFTASDPRDGHPVGSVDCAVAQCTLVVGARDVAEHAEANISFS
jgi:hypothetical protein